MRNTETVTTSTRRSYARSEQQYAEACTVLAGGVNSNFRLHGQPVPLVFARGAGARLYDVDGNVYVDYALGMGPNILGHAPEPVIRAVAETLSDGQLSPGSTPVRSSSPDECASWCHAPSWCASA